MVSHFALASSHLLRGTDLFDIIPGHKFLKKQNSFIGLLLAFSFIFNHQKKFRNFLNLMTSALKAQAARVEQIAYLFCVVFTLRFQQHQVLAGANIWLPQQKHPGQNHEFHHLELWELEPQLCQYPKIQHWFDDLSIH